MIHRDCIYVCDKSVKDCVIYNKLQSVNDNFKYEYE